MPIRLVADDCVSIRAAEAHRRKHLVHGSIPQRRKAIIQQLTRESNKTLINTLGRRGAAMLGRYAAAVRASRKKEAPPVGGTRRGSIVLLPSVHPGSVANDAIVTGYCALESLTAD
jgi:hypothetical protein